MTRRSKSVIDLRRLAAAILAKAGYSLRDAAKILSVSQQTVKNSAGQYAAEITVTFGETIFDVPSFTHLEDASNVYDDEL
jgi:predicted transcriptional regulator